MDNHLDYLYAIVQPLNRPYFTISAIARITTVELRDPAVLNYYVGNGFVYIRRLHYNYNHILREPTDGCNVELTKRWELGSIPIDSYQARKLIKRISYF